jgi:hypothetical protein
MKTDSETNLSTNSYPDKEQGLTNMDNLIKELRERDARQKKTYRRFSIMMIVLVIFYFALLVVNPDPYLTILKRISGLCYVIAFLIGAYLFRKENKAMAAINYTEPLLKVMKDAVERYRPFKKGFLCFLLIPLFVDFGISLSGPTEYFPDDWSNFKSILIIQVVFWSIMATSAIISYFVWNNRSKSYRNAVQEMIRDLDS